MSIQIIPTSTGGGIKLIQRGQAVSAGDITITAVDTTKTFVESFSEGASGTVALSGSTTGTFSPSGGSISGSGERNSGLPQAQAVNTGGSFASYTGTRTLSGGTMDATTGQMGVYLVNSTTLTATGACRYQVVEFA
jgi:hypothetical protein